MRTVCLYLQSSGKRVWSLIFLLFFTASSIAISGNVFSNGLFKNQASGHPDSSNIRIEQNKTEAKQDIKSEKLSGEVRQEKRHSRSAIKELQNDLDAILKSRDITNTHVGVCVMSADNGDYLFRSDDIKNYIPASIQKIITTSAALDILGSSFRFTTRLYLTGKVSPKGDYIGNIIVRGSGDPTLDPLYGIDPIAVITQWVKVLDSLGIRSITGNIIVDDSYFDATAYAPGWMWDDMIYPYSAPVSAVSFNGGSFDIAIYPGVTIGTEAKIDINKDIAGSIKIINEIRTTDTEDETDIHAERISGSNIYILRGQISLGAKTGSSTEKVSLTIENPAYYLGTVFRYYTELSGIPLKGAVFTNADWTKRIDYTQAQVIHEHFSPPLSAIVSVINTMSHNLGAEILLKTIGKESTGIGSFSRGVDVVKQYLQKIGVNSDDMIIVDGSGLSRLNSYTPQQLTTLLWSISRNEKKQQRYVQTSQIIQPPTLAFADELAQPGEKGTLRNRLLGTIAEKKLRAKTGTLNNVSNIAGYITTKDNELLCFTIMMNGLTAPESVVRNIQDMICMRLASFTRKI